MDGMCGLICGELERSKLRKGIAAGLAGASEIGKDIIPFSEWDRGPTLESVRVSWRRRVLWRLDGAMAPERRSSALERVEPDRFSIAGRGSSLKLVYYPSCLKLQNLQSCTSL